ncbi:hypothetical protein INS49_010927 [Diaporthe citri]|uniref:uncharacterized protein n=1 Tax=Diaporthe citri TaxID=83186 RepID=UPI001C80E97B|nr:uncharacterized protein INS49_010927 [Diaporthe citri]KAG6359874.1 hypothetical protein INS49_010927 [Diaporthe citri]
MKTQTFIVALLAAAAEAALVRIPRQANNGTASAGGATGGAAAGGADFGSCTPTMDFQTGRAEFNRKADEGTFFPTDATLVGNSGQSDALNPNIITNFICDQLTNVCGANDAAVSQCEDAQAQVEGLGTKDQSTADAFNSALGF